MKCMIPENDLNQRLNDSICRYRGFPYRVRTMGGKNLALHSISKKSNEPEYIITSDDPEFDISGIPLGYVQVNPTTVAYISRKPARIWKQGVTGDSLMTHFLSKNNSPGAIFNLYSPYVENMILNKYPTLEDAKKLLRVQKPGTLVTEIAISRDVALKYDHEMQFTHVYYKQNKVGYIIKDSNTVITPTNDMGWIISKYLSYFNWQVE